MMKKPSDYYLTVRKHTQVEYKDKGSRFIAHIQMISDEASFSSLLLKLKSEHHKANHHCYALRLRSDQEHPEGLSRSSDDGEPSGTAGKPILNQLVSASLENVACVVVRYFGGTKLGTSGLIQAYKTASAMAIEHAGIKKAWLRSRMKINFSYAIMGQLMDAVKSLGYKIDQNQFGSEPYIIISFKRSQAAVAENKIKASLLQRSVDDIQEDTRVEGLVFENTQAVE